MPRNQLGTNISDIDLIIANPMVLRRVFFKFISLKYSAASKSIIKLVFGIGDSNRVEFGARLGKTAILVLAGA